MIGHVRFGCKHVCDYVLNCLFLSLIRMSGRGKTRGGRGGRQGRPCRGVYEVPVNEVLVQEEGFG